MLRSIISKNVGSATKHLEELSQDYAKKEAEIDKQLEEIKRKSQEALALAQEQGQKQKAEIIKEAQEEKTKVLNAAQAKVDEMIQQADRASKALLAQMDKKIDESARVQALKLLQTALPESLRIEIHRQWVAVLISGNLQQIENLRVDEGIKEVLVSCAFSLTPEERNRLMEKIKEKLGREIELKEELSPELLSGLIVKIGSLVFDGSLKSRIQEAAYNQEI